MTDDTVTTVCDAIARLHRHAAAVRESQGDAVLLAPATSQSEAAPIAR
jgi:hypothetical protein